MNTWVNEEKMLLDQVSFLFWLCLVRFILVRAAKTNTFVFVVRGRSQPHIGSGYSAAVVS